MRYAFALLASAQLAIGAAAIFARFALTGGGPLAVSSFRLLFAAVPVVAVAATYDAYRVHDRGTEWRLSAAGVMLAVHFACWIASLRYASVAVSTLLVCSTPIWTECFAVACDRRIRADVLSSILLALGGVAVVIGNSDRAQTPLGVALALAGALAIALYLLLVRASDPRYGTLAVVGRTYPIAAGVLLAVTLLVHDPVPPLAASTAWGGIAAMALISQLFGHTALNAAVRTLSATLVATVTLIEPAIAGLLAALIFGERLSIGTLAGSTILLAAIAIAVRAERSKNARLATQRHVG